MITDQSSSPEELKPGQPAPFPIVSTPIPEWVEDAVFYEVYPQTYQDSNGDGVGDIPGITSRLDYIASLGVSAIWLNPFYKSPMRDAGYDIADFRAVDPRYGTLDDLRILFGAAHSRGLRVIVDFVPGHTSIDHPWFKASASREPNTFSNWYIWTDSAWNNGGPKWSEKMIHGYSDRNGNYLINFFWSQPALNFGFAEPDPDQPWQLSTTHPDVRRLWNEMRETMVFWMKQGADGFRVDMAGSITRRDQDGMEARRFWAEAREACTAVNPDFFTVAEWSHPTNALDGRGLHADFLHWIPSYENLFRKELARTPGGPRRCGGHSWFDRSGQGDLRAFLDDYLAHYHATLGKGCISVPIGNHDLPRISIDRNEEDLAIIFAFLLTMPGVPFIYAGDEIGVRQLEDIPVQEGCYPPRNGARTPMPWDSGEPNLGFSKATKENLWAPVDHSPDAPTVRDSEARNGSLLHLVRKLIRLRRTHPALKATGTFTPLYCETDAYPFAYLRECSGERLLVVLNPSERASFFELDMPVSFAGPQLAGCQCNVGSPSPHRTLLEMPPVSFTIQPIAA